jgi:hypothetical protein
MINFICTILLTGLLYFIADYGRSKNGFEATVLATLSLIYVTIILKDKND